MREPAGASASPTTIEGSATPRAKISCATWMPASVAPTPMRTTDATSLSKLIEYDSIKRRLWILGQRCHHGATGSVVAAEVASGVDAAWLDRVRSC